MIGHDLIMFSITGEAMTGFFIPPLIHVYFIQGMWGLSMKDSPLFLSAVIKCILHEASTLEYEHWSQIMQISTSATICVLLSQLKIGMMESLQSKSISNAGNLANSTADAP